MPKRKSNRGQCNNNMYMYLHENALKVAMIKK